MILYVIKNSITFKLAITCDQTITYFSLKPGVGNRPVITYATPEPGRLVCVISIEIGVNGDAYPAAVSQKVAKNLPVSFYSPTSGFKKYTIAWGLIKNFLICLYMYVIEDVRNFSHLHVDGFKGINHNITWISTGQCISKQISDAIQRGCTMHLIGKWRYRCNFRLKIFYNVKGTFYPICQYVSLKGFKAEHSYNIFGMHNPCDKSFQRPLILFRNKVFCESSWKIASYTYQWCFSRAPTCKWI